MSPLPWLTPVVVAGLLLAPTGVPPDAPEPDPTVAYGLDPQLTGPEHDVAAARERLLADVREHAPDRGAPNGSSTSRGRVTNLAGALDWVHRWAFPTAVGFDHALRDVVAPRPGGQPFGMAQLRALRIIPVNADGTDGRLQWPTDPRPLVQGLRPGWRVAAVLAERAPLFAAPAPRLPPAAERSGWALRRGDILMLGELDRCTGGPQRLCMRWAQVVARVDEGFAPGYLPTAQIAPLGDWIEGDAPLPRAQLRPVGLDGDTSIWQMVARTDDGRLHRRVFHGPSPAGGYPPGQIQISGSTATIKLGTSPPEQVDLTPDLDARPDSPVSPTAPEPH